VENGHWDAALSLGSCNFHFRFLPYNSSVVLSGMGLSDFILDEGGRQVWGRILLAHVASFYWQS
jgi:hypothetical protein